MSFSRKTLNVLPAIAIVGVSFLAPNIAHADEGQAKTVVNVQDNKVSMDKWDELARVSSNGDWKANTGNGLYGGLAISDQTWKDYHGEDFAPTADKATKEQQIEIAENIYAENGFNPWDGARVLGWVTPPAPVQQAPQVAEQTVTTDYSTTQSQNTYITQETYQAPVQQSTTSSYSGGSGVWDSIAQCESGGNWGTNTGNGFSGGLQFSPDTWAAYGGTGDASNASREQQIAVAERVQAAQGWGAWPACSASLGLQ